MGGPLPPEGCCPSRPPQRPALFRLSWVASGHPAARLSGPCCPLGTSFSVPPQDKQLGCEASGGKLPGQQVDSRVWARPRRQSPPKSQAESCATPMLFPCKQLILYQMPAFLLPHNLPWPPSTILSPAVVPGQAFGRSPLCPWHTKL